MSRTLKILLILVVVLTGLTFHLRNEQLIAIDYYIGSNEFPVSLVVAGSLFIGAVLGVLSSLPIMIKLKRENARLNGQLKTSEKELNNLRVIPIKDSH